jgi:hypothetical protein
MKWVRNMQPYQFRSIEFMPVPVTGDDGPLRRIDNTSWDGNPAKPDDIDVKVRIRKINAVNGFRKHPLFFEAVHYCRVVDNETKTAKCIHRHAMTLAKADNSVGTVEIDPFKEFVHLSEDMELRKGEDGEKQSA